MKIVFLATPDITLKTFEFFINSKDYEVLALVTQRAKEEKRGKKIVERNITKMAKSYSIPVFEPDKISKDENVIAKLKALKPDFFVTFAYGQLLSEAVINIPSIATINLHASLLPQYRGANPIAQAIIDGQAKTGITTMKTVLALDAGDICLQEEIEISESMNVIELSSIISDKSPDLLDKTLKGLYDGTLKTTIQDDSKATFTKKMKKEEKIIDWTMSAIDLHNKIRGMYQLNTNHTMFNNKIIKVLKTEPVPLKETTPGEVLKIDKTGITVSTSIGSIKLITLKPEGKGEMRAFDWVNGSKITVGDKFQCLKD